jgi:hypothetical protein
MAGLTPTGAGAGAATAGDGDAPDPHAGGENVEHDDWYRWGRVVLYAEMLLAVLVTVFSLYLAFTGSAGFLT